MNLLWIVLLVIIVIALIRLSFAILMVAACLFIVHYIYMNYGQNAATTAAVILAVLMILGALARD